MGGLGLAVHAAALEVRPPAVADLQLHAGPAPVGRGHGRAGITSRASATRCATIPNDYVVFPAPAGPKGRAYLPVLAGLAIPKTAPNAAGAKQLIEFLDGVSAQARTAAGRGLLPGRRAAALEAGRPRAAHDRSRASRRSSGRRTRCRRSCPVGLGGQGGQLQPRLHRHVHADRDQPGGHQEGPGRPGPKLQDVLNAAERPAGSRIPSSTGTCQVGAN